MTYADNVNLANVLMTDLLTFTAIVINSGSELEHPEKESCDAVFTSPPFFDREKYFDEPGQCWRDHSTLESWRDAYVVPTLLNAQTALKSGGYLALHLPLNLVDLFIKAAADNCIDLVRVPESDIELELRIDHFSKVRGLYDNKKELLITWQKILKS